MPAHPPKVCITPIRQAEPGIMPKAAREEVTKPIEKVIRVVIKARVLPLPSE